MRQLSLRSCTGPAIEKISIGLSGNRKKIIVSISNAGKEFFELLLLLETFALISIFIYLEINGANLILGSTIL